MLHAPPRVAKQRRLQDAALPPVSGPRLAGSSAWHDLHPCPGYGYWVSYLCMVLVFGFGFHGNSATPGWGLRCVRLGTGFCFAPSFLAWVCSLCGWTWVLACTPPFLAGVFRCVWLCAFSACTPPFLAGVCVVGVCAWVRALAAPRHSWLGFWGLCVFVCALRLYPALLHGACGVGVCPSAPVLAAPRHSWLGCWGVCVFVCALRLYPATPGWGVRFGCVCLNSGFGCAPPLLAGG